MTRFAQIARRHAEDAFIRFLFVGDPSPLRTRVLAAAGETNCFETIEALDLSDLLQDDAEGVVRSEHDVNVFNGSVVIVWDLGRLALGTLARQLPLSRGGHPAGLSCTQRLMFGVVRSPELTFEEFTTAISLDFAGIGDVDQCLKAISSWCHPNDSRPSIDLTLSAPKQPSGWVREIAHDYFGNALLFSTADAVRRAGLWELHRAMDVWQDALRNVLVFPLEDRPHRQLGPPDHPPFDMEVRMNARPPRLIVPRVIEADLGVALTSRGVDHVFYTSADDAHGQLEQAGRDGRAAVLLRAPNESVTIPSVSQHGDFVAQVLVDHSAFRTTWAQWQGLLANNVVGSFSLTAACRSGDGAPLAARKARYWRAFCSRPMIVAVDQIIDTMILTYENLDAAAAASTRPFPLESIFRCLAQVWCARALYFGSTPYQAANLVEGTLS